MKRQLYLFVFFCFSCSLTFAHHVVGGEIYYSYIGPGTSAGSSIYSVTLRLFRNCNADPNTTAPLPGNVMIGIFTNQYPYTSVEVLSVDSTSFGSISLTTYPVCISTKPPVCYQVATYTQQVQLDDTQVGYRLSFQTCCRLGSLNVTDDAANTTGVPGATYECVIPGTNILPTGHNSCAVFKEKDTALVCSGSKFTLDFGALDPDLEDSLGYSFTAAYDGGLLMNASDVPPGNPLYTPVNYTAPYTSGSPLGNTVNINSQTGLISGIAPTAGPYVVCVQANEYRAGILISSHRKDFILVVSNCNIPQATLNSSYINCGNYTFTFSDNSNSVQINSYYWDFGEPGVTNDTSTMATPTFTYSDTGTFNVKLIVNKGEQCTDSTTATAKVYPGLFPKIGIYGNCISEPYQFIDSTKTNYGVVNYWMWNFDSTDQNSDDYNPYQNPTHQFADTGRQTIEFIVGNSKGCLDTLYKSFDVMAKPLINVPFNDTLICLKDTLQLFSSTNALPGGAYTLSWSPDYNISNTTIDSPYVYPATTTSYVVSINDNKGCSNSDTVVVNVVPFVIIDAKPDTTICKTDSITLRPNTNALKFLWSPALGLSDSTVENPVASPDTTTTYTVLATIGHCSASDTKTIKVVPYPKVQTFGDTSICYGNTAQLNAVITGAYFQWSPSNSLLHPNTLSPIAGPQVTTQYVLSVTDTLGCPKPSTDTVTVTVIPKVQAFAGDDTTIVAGQPLQLNATGGTTYEWTPTTGMNNSNIANPIVTLGTSIDSITYAVRVSIPQSCFATDSLTVFVFKTPASIFIPTGFTPNGDGRNDILRPILVGMKQLNFFNIYNRLGNLIFSTSQIGTGWDGTYSGIKQPSGTYVFSAEGVTYLGNTIKEKGTVVLIR